jgi:cytochrome c oxidase subunit 2
MLRRLSILPASLVLSTLAGCRYAQSTFNPHGPAAHKISDLSEFMTLLFLVITLIMGVLIAFAFYRRRGSLQEHEPIQSGGGQMWIAIGGIAIPLIVLTVLFVLGLGLLRDFPIHGMHGGASHAEMMHSMKPEILIIGHQWWWEIHYLNDDPSQQFTTANEIHLPVGRSVNIEVESHDVMHSFWVPALHGKVDLIPGQANYIRLEATEAGEYSGQCAEFCGAQHAHMRILAIAQEADEYEAWLEGQRKAAAEPTTPEALAGQQVFLSGPCSMCHTVRGTVAGGSVAPDLTHIGSRKMIAANSFQNNDAYLEAWVTHAQSLKPQAQMPNLTQFSGEQLTDLVAYLRQLQ